MKRRFVPIVRKQILLAFAISSLLLSTCNTSLAAGIDCNKATSAVETSICANSKLRSADGELAALYMSLANGTNKEAQPLSPEEKVILAKDQRSWILRREQKCGDLNAEPLLNCISDAIGKRKDELRKDWGLDTEEFANGKLIVGSEVVEIVEGPDKGWFRMLHKGEELVNVPRDGAFEIQRAFQTSNGAAALMQIGGGYTGRCGDLTIFFTKQPGQLNMEVLDNSCLSFGSQNAPTIERTVEGFKSVTLSGPATPGSEVTWDLTNGRKQQEIQFAPAPKSKMLDFFSAKKADFSTPALNEEFFQAVNKLPSKDAGRIMAALWQPTGGCATCGNEENPELYGGATEGDAVYFTGCGYGFGLQCGQDDALGVWDRTTHQFYFALDTHRVNGLHVSGDVTHYPDMGSWSLCARRILDGWYRGTLRPN